MGEDAITRRVKELISRVTNIPVDELADDADFIDDLALDSIDRAESVVDVDYEFKLGFPEEELLNLRTVRQTADLVRTVLAEKAIRQPILQKIKEAVSKVTKIRPENISDDEHFIDDLYLDSSSLLEIGLDVDFEFKLGATEEQLMELRSVQQTVDLVRKIQAEKEAQR